MVQGDRQHGSELEGGTSAEGRADTEKDRNYKYRVT